MPYDIAKGFDGCPYAVVKLTPDGRELAPGGCHQTAIEAGKHLAALQAATDYERGELRHPGAHDQAVHNPNKQVSFASKMMAPEKLAAERARTKEEMDRLADGATPADRAEAMDEYDAASASAAKFEQHSTATSGLFKSESDIGGAAGEAAIKTSKALAKEYLTIKNRINRKASTAKREGNYARSKAFRIAADGAGRLEFASGLSGFLSSVRGKAIVLEMELRHPGHADQSTHNPHKGGGAAGGFVRPVAQEQSHETDMAKQLTDAEWKATAYSHGLTPELEPDKPLPSEILTPAEIDAVDEYEGGSSTFQQALIDPENSRPSDLAQAAALRQVVERNSLQEATVLHRGIGGSGIVGSQMETKLRSAGVGGVVQTDRFVSSAANPKIARGFGTAEMVISAPAGTKGAYLDRVMNLNRDGGDAISFVAKKYAIPGRGESEFVMPPGVKFRIDNIVESGPNNRTRFEVTVVP